MESIPSEQIHERLRAENTWWTDPSVVHRGYDALRPRAYLNLFAPLVFERSVRRAVVLMGPRRVGKTVLIHHAIRQLLHSGAARPTSICYLSVDHPLYKGLGLEQLLTHLSSASGVDYRAAPDAFVFFDEIQYLRDWEVHLKALVDSYPGVKFVASGSAAAALRLHSGESGAGRFTDFLLPPLTFHEYLELAAKMDLIGPPHAEGPFEDWYETTDISALNEAFIHYLNFGGYPEVVLSPEIQRDPGRFIKSDIVDKVLLRDLPSLYGIDNIQELNYLFTTLAYNTAGEVSLGELSRNSGVAKNTIKRYVEYLEAAFLLKVVHRLDRNAKRFQRANFFKVYLTNPSIRAALFAPIEPEHDALSRLAETGIYSQWFHNPRPLHYARWDKGEVDIVHLNTKQKPDWAVEVKWTDRFVEKPHELASLAGFCNANAIAEVVVTTKTQFAVRQIGELKVTFIPTSIYCYTVGHNVVRARTLQAGMVSEQVALWEAVPPR